MEGKIILTTFPQGRQQKLRPALVLREFPKYGDILVCGITSQLHQYIPDFDLVIDSSNPDYRFSGLKMPGICRLNMLTMLRLINVNGTIGKISATSHDALLKTLANYLVKK